MPKRKVRVPALLSELNALRNRTTALGGTDEPTGTISVPWPFYRARIDDQFDPLTDSWDSWWIPGHETLYDQHGHERRCADGMGEMILTVVHVCELPKPYRRRVFYTRRFRAPDGYEFGKRDLRMMGLAAFTRMAAGYRYPVEIERGINNSTRLDHDTDKA